MTPVLIHRYSWPKFSAISGVSTDRRLFMLVRRGSISKLQHVIFLRHLLRHVRGRIILVWDNLRAHKARMVQDFVYQHRRRLSIEFLPPYAPELNPDEWLWRHLKHVELPNFAPNDLPELKKQLRLSVMRVRMRPNLIHSFFRASSLPF